jgi:hypothetical protein
MAPVWILGAVWLAGPLSLLAVDLVISNVCAAQSEGTRLVNIDYEKGKR